VEIYYVQCKSCPREIEVERKPFGENIATAFSANWTRTLVCSCEASRNYVRADLKSKFKREPPAPQN